MKDWLLPARTFEHSRSPQRDLVFARFILSIVYLGGACVIIYYLRRMLVLQHVEVIVTELKMDEIEVPSLAICPFRANSTLVKPVDNRTWFKVMKIEAGGSRPLHVPFAPCQFDRECVCVDLHSYWFSDRIAATARGRADHFRESLQVITSLTDSSPERSLRLGLYDSTDPSPNWCYATQGSYWISQLSLKVWKVTDVSGLLYMMRRAAAKTRHLFTCTSQEVGVRGSSRGWNETAIEYHMQDFFVDETMSSETAYSLYSLAFLVMLLLMRSVVLDAFMAAMFPLWEEPRELPQQRRLSCFAEMARSWLCCCLRFGDDDNDNAEAEKGERKPLMQ